MLEMLSKKSYNLLYFLLQAKVQIPETVVRTSNNSSSILIFASHLTSVWLYGITIESIRCFSNKSGKNIYVI